MARRTTYPYDKRTTASQAAAYTEGNTVRVTRQYVSPERYEEMPEREPQRRRELNTREDQEAQRRRRQVRRNRDKLQYMSGGFVLFTAVAAVCILFIAINYLQVKSSIVMTMNTIEARELELERVKANNDLLERKIQTYTDLDYIYQVATTELGMVRPGEDQVLYYESTESEYVRQYEQIP